MAGDKQLGSIVYQVEMDVADLIAAQQKVNQRLDQMDGSFNKSSQSAGRFEGALNKVGVAIGAAFTLETAKRLIAIGDEMNTLQARVARLSPSIDAARETMKSLSVIASQTGSSLSDTERLWESMTSALKETGATNSQILALTSTLQKIGTIGGSSAEEMSNALRQFGQSIAGGTVRAEEFNSILEQMPELARQIASGLGISIGELRKRMLEGKLSATDALNAIQDRSQAVNEEFDKMPVSIERAKNSLDVAFRNAISDLNQAIGLTSTLAGLMQNVADNLNFYNNNAGDAARMPKLIKLQQDLNKEVQEGQRWYETDTVFQQRRGQAAFELKKTEQEIASIRAKAAQDAKNNSGFKPSGTKGDDAATQKLVKNSERRLALSKLEGEARARLQAQYDAADAGVTDQKRVKAIEDQYAATYRNTEAQKENNREGKTSASQAEAIAQKLENLKEQSELAADSTSQLSREQAILNAQQSLGKSATQAQIDLAGQYAAKKWDTANAIKAQAAAEKLLPEARENASYKQDVDDLKTALAAKKISQEQYDKTAERLEANHQANLAKIRAQQVVTPQQSAKGEVDPVQRLANQHAQELALIQQFESQKGQLTQRGLELTNAANRKYEQERIAAQWEIFRNQNAGTEALAASIDALAGNASNALTGIITGSMTASDAMRSLGSTVLNSLVNTFVQMGVEWVKSAIMGGTAQKAAIVSTTAVQNAAVGTQLAVSSGAAAATTAAWTPAAIMASIASMGTAAKIGLAAVAVLGVGALAGKRKNGGPVSAGGMYQVGEGGMPEIYQASTGKQYMIPGDNGKVISNKDMTSGGGVNVIINVQNMTGATFDAQATNNRDGTITVDAIIADLNNGGPISQGITSNFNAKRTPRGQN
ncbi:tape measure protein [Citrobacter sp. Cf088]|uniref:tape measure protein n=1 Tax=Citrobacter sp. Cf088 TaxID=2985055 RepID=UPI00257717B4|nr:tape measure protein [Citrobacter sp. Cf088]MDM3222491.1 tape measure protein [Citrobacter sp. Cf088]